MSFETLHIRAKKRRGGNKRIISRAFDEYLVARFDYCGHDHEISHRRAGCCDYVVGRNTALSCEGLLKRLITIPARPAQFDVVDRRPEFGYRIVRNPACCKIESGLRTGLCP